MMCRKRRGEKFQSSDGLTQAEAQKRLTQYGPNELAEKKTNLFLMRLTMAPVCGDRSPAAED